MARTYRPWTALDIPSSITRDGALRRRSARLCLRSLHARRPMKHDHVDGLHKRGWTPMKNWQKILLSGCICTDVWSLSGCSSHKPTTRPTGAYDRQEAALKDPFGYSPMDDQS